MSGLDSITFANIQFVSSSVKAATEIVSSIEQELGDIRETIRRREQLKIDQYSLITLLEAENRALKHQSELLELQLRQEREREQDEDERVQVAYAEMDRVQLLCNQALAERDEYLYRLTEIEQQHGELQHQWQHTQTKLDHALAELQDANVENNRLKNIIVNLQAPIIQHQRTSSSANNSSASVTNQLVEKMEEISSRMESLEIENQLLRNSHSYVISSTAPSPMLVSSTQGVAAATVSHSPANVHRVSNRPTTSPLTARVKSLLAQRAVVAGEEGEADNSGVFDLTPTSPVYSPSPASSANGGAGIGSRMRDREDGGRDGVRSAADQGYAGETEPSPMSRPLLSPDDSLDSYREGGADMPYGSAYGYFASSQLGDDGDAAHGDIQLHDILKDF